MAACTFIEPFRVLIVDDCPDTTESLAILVRAWGFQVLVANDGRTALRLAAEHGADAVVLDIGMPGMDGWEVARHLRRMPGLDRAYLIVVSGFGAQDHQSRSHEVGCDLHLTKPVEPNVLQKVLSARAERGPSSCHLIN